MTHRTTGRFVRRDLMTTDVDGAIGFYTGLVGWGIEKRDAGGFEARFFANDGEDQGAAVPFDAQPGIGSHWMPYIAVDDIDALCAAVEEHGGTVCMKPFALPGYGRFAIIEDPKGGFTSPVQLEAPDAVPQHDRPPLGAFCWAQLLTSDAEAVLPFYAAVFGWTAQKMPMPGNPTWMVMVDDDAIGTVMQKPADAIGQARDHWLGYIAVPDCAKATAAAVEAGATVHVPPELIPTMGRFSVLSDPTGAEFALWEDVSQSTVGGI